MKGDWRFIVSEKLMFALANANNLQQCICGDIWWPGEYHDCVGNSEEWPPREDWDESLDDDFEDEEPDEGLEIPSLEVGGFGLCQ